jgi:hypothetical protein
MNSVFISSGHDDSWTNYNVRDTWDLMSEGFLNAGFYLIDDIISNYHNPDRTKDLDELIYPICFMFRHYIEVRMKSIIVEFYQEEEKVNKIIIECQHSLEKLWIYIKEIHAIKYEKLDTTKNDYIEQVEAYIHEINKIDQNSFTFRYPTTKKGNRALEIPRISYSNLRESMIFLSRFFDSLYDRFYMLNEIGK